MHAAVSVLDDTLALAGCSGGAQRPTSNLPTSGMTQAQSTYKIIGAIASDVNGSDGLWADKAGNLYVANYLGDNVT